MRPGDSLRFVPTTVQEATTALKERWEQACEVEAVEVDSISPEDLNVVYATACNQSRHLP